MAAREFGNLSNKGISNNMILKYVGQWVGG